MKIVYDFGVVPGCRIPCPHPIVKGHAMFDVINRHPGTQHFETLFDYAHLPEELQDISRPFHELAAATVELLPDGPELSACLRKLLEAKDCAVRAAVLAIQEA